MITKKRIVLLLLTCYACILEEIHAITHGTKFKKRFKANPLDMVILTQKGYIQFLKYTAEVPPMTEYTFCIWLRSNNLSHSHPILSYSKHEEERLIRVWISPHGESINLEILGHLVEQVKVKIKENQWYHICQSWSAYQGAWAIYLDSKLISHGTEPKLTGVLIKSGGDIVIGQEYTDFDKGLDDGIEGDIFGFNFVLAPTSRLIEKPRAQRKADQSNQLASEIDRVTSFVGELMDGLFGMKSSNSTTRENAKENDTTFASEKSNEIHFSKESNGDQMNDSTSVFPLVRSSQDFEEFRKPLGLFLVELSYDCTFGRGAPLDERDVLIHWTKSPVRVFGGAVMKQIGPFCK